MEQFPSGEKSKKTDKELFLEFKKWLMPHELVAISDLFEKLTQEDKDILDDFFWGDLTYEEFEQYRDEEIRKMESGEIESNSYRIKFFEIMGNKIMVREVKKMKKE